jgi:type VI secretion system protein ImpB
LVRYMDGKVAAEESLRKLLSDPQLMKALKDRVSKEDKVEGKS